MSISLVEFTAAWCGPCKVMKPILDSLSASYGVSLRYVDVEVDRDLADQFLVKSMPTLVVMRDGKEVGRVVGSRPRAFVAGVIDRALAGDVAIACP